MKKARSNYIILFLCLIGSISYSQHKETPNILFVMSDDHCGRGIGIYGERLAPLNPTPNIDKMAREGMVFNNVFCTNSICTPSRATIITGQYSHKNKVFDLYDGLPGEKHYLLKEMQHAGYTTAVVGKWYLEYEPQYADFYAVIAGQGKYINPVMNVSEGGEKRMIKYSSVLSKEVEVIDTKGHSSDVLTDISLDWLKNKRDKQKPFFLMHHFKAPHDMFVYADRYKDYLADVDIPEPDNLYNQPSKYFGSIATRGENDALIEEIGSTISPNSGRKRSLTKRYQAMGKIPVDSALSKKELTHLTYQLYLKEYLRCVKGIDDNLQRILDYLKDNNLTDNTIIVYTSDQGMFLGEHDFIDKRWIYEESIRMPLIIKYPKMIKPKSENNWLINNADYAPTLLNLAGIDSPDYMQGKSFIGALKGNEEPKNWRNATYYRYWMHMAHTHNNPAHFGIRTKKHKLIFFYGIDYKSTHNHIKVEEKEGNRYWKNTPVDWELYDLEKDPKEMINQYNNPDYATIVEKLKKELIEIRKEVGDTDEDFPRIQKIINKNLLVSKG